MLQAYHHIKSSYVSSTGDVNLVGDSIGLITNITGQKVGIEVTGTGNGISMDASVGTDKAAVTGQEIIVKADGAINAAAINKANLFFIFSPCNILRSKNLLKT